MIVRVGNVQSENVCDLGFEYLIKFLVESNSMTKDFHATLYIKDYEYKNLQPDEWLFEFYECSVLNFK